MRAIVGRVTVGAAGAFGVLALVCVMDALVDVRSFEWSHLFVFLGWSGLTFSGFLLVGLTALSIALLRMSFSKSRTRRIGMPLTILFSVWVVAVIWLGEWLFMEAPLTAQLRDQLTDASDEREATVRAMKIAETDGSIAAFAATFPHLDAERLAIMLRRISINRPSVFAQTSIGVTIEKYATKYDVDPVLLLDWIYLDSFYGEAPAGPMPMFGEINPEMFRDLVQAHLPAWFVESPIRVALIEGPWLQLIAGQYFGLKLRYAFQKATYDIAISPYMNSVFSDTFLVLREYRSEFPELFDSETPTDPLARAFMNLEGNGLLTPYNQPYSHTAEDAAYYDRYRDDLISFARAAVYRISGDFEFATKVQALIAKYYAAEYAKRIGAERWGELSDRQRTVLLAILRDVYVPNIGKVSYNLYMVPEFNCTPIDFVAAELDRDFDRARNPDRMWTPQHQDRLWGATGLMLRTLGEVWDVMTGQALAGVPPADTIADARKVIARNQ